jgi:hydrogenase nickel incorporation protein HypA/HybF
VHELSIAQSLVELAEEAARRAGAARVLSVQARVGALAGVVPDSLRFCYDLATDGTLLAGSRLDVEEVPVRVWCGPCGREVEPAPPRGLRCPSCGAASGDVRQGKELELRSIEIDRPEPGSAA